MIRRLEAFYLPQISPGEPLAPFWIIIAASFGAIQFSVALTLAITCVPELVTQHRSPHHKDRPPAPLHGIPQQHHLVHCRFCSCTPHYHRYLFDRSISDTTTSHPPGSDPEQHSLQASRKPPSQYCPSTPNIRRSRLLKLGSIPFRLAECLSWTLLVRPSAAGPTGSVV
ncbi:hypothetical protein MN608_06278 [Microdochium nivale]|nr:hypothetical protein MN608_06278 [Microdochium nivale]